MTWIHRALAGVAGLALLSLSACGGGSDDEPSGASTTAAASVADFCSTWEDALNGLAAGIGSSLALASDFQVAKEDDYFLQAFVNVGLMGDGAAHELIAASIGRARAARMLMLGERLPNPEAYAAGLITHCVPAGEWQATVDGLVEKLASGPTMAYARIKSTINAAALLHLDETLATETVEQGVLGASHDFAEGVAAFSEKRQAKFTGS